jgi:hypothetical protein
MEFWTGAVFGFCFTILAEFALIVFYLNSKGGKK